MKQRTLGRTPSTARWIGAATALLTVALLAPHAVYARSSPAMIDVFPEPGLPNPHLRFATGRVVNNAPEMFPMAPAMPGPVSAWGIGQWHREDVISPLSMRRNPGTPIDPTFGRPLYAFAAADGDSSLTIYREGVSGPFVYDLFGRNGTLVTDGGANLFLGAESTPAARQMDAPMRYALRARINRAAVSYDTPTAASSGAVLAQVFSGFVLHHDPSNGTGNITVFMQIPIARSNNGSSEYASCSRNKHGDIVVTSDHLLPGDRMLPFAASRTPLAQLEYDLSAHLQAVLEQILRCREPSGQVTALRLADTHGDLAGWIVKSAYVGLETEQRDARQSSRDTAPQGAVEVGLQVSDIRIWKASGAVD